MTQDFEDAIEAGDPLGLTEPDNLFPDVLDAAPTPAAKTARDLVKVDLRAAAIARFGDWRPQATALVDRVKGKTYPDIHTPAGLKEATADRAALREPRLKAQKVAEAVKKQLRSIAGDVGVELESIIAILKPEEERIGEVITAENERREEIKRQETAAEADRQRALEANIAKIRDFAQHAQGRDAAGVQRLIDTLQGFAVKDEEWGDYAARANAALSETIQILTEKRDALELEVAIAVQRAAADATAREREQHLQAQADALAQQRAALEAQQRAMTHMGEWAAMPTQMPGPGEFTVTQLEEAVASLAAENPDTTTFGAMLPVALIAHSTALAHMRGLVDLARRRDFAMSNIAIDNKRVEESRAFGPADADGVIQERSLEPSSGHITATRSGTTTTSWDALAAPAPASRVLYGDEPIGEQSYTPLRPVATTPAVAAVLAEREPAVDVDPALALLNMGAMNERFGFTLTRAYVENTLKVPARREDRRAAFWTEDDYVLIAARISEKMDAIVVKGMGGA